MNISPLSSAQSSLTDIRTRIEERKRQLAEQKQNTSDVVQISSKGTRLGSQTEISYEEASSLVEGIQQSSQDANTLTSVHNLDLARVLELIS
ncbi:hypothetical protein [Solidesulfovibrio alcoholivorans]|uniref:hypothetical protein n=1 Tax=Solidesulfovibrio alcoholivorans TaxID=81406 RepID=UPI0012EC2469|nr:hypothetical protein [Solidesulfovibrio alcoholivorans]